MKICIRNQEIKKNDRKVVKRRKKKGEEEEKYSVFCQRFILSVKLMKDFDILLVCVVGYRMNLNINIYDI